MKDPGDSIYGNTTMSGFGNMTYDLQGTTKAPTSSGYSSEKHPLAHFLEIYYSLALLVFGTIGNLLSLAVLSRKAFRSSPIGICLRLLALADLTALYTGPLYFTAIALHDYNFRKVSVASCRIHRLFSYVSVDLSAWTLVVMSTARLSSVLWPMKTIFTRRKTYITLFVTLLIIIGINSPTFILYGTVHLPKRTLRCVATNPSYRYFTDNIWSWLVLVKFGLLPGSILLVMNIVLVIRVYRSRRHIDEMNDEENRNNRASISTLGRARLSLGRWLKSAKLSGGAWRGKTNVFAQSSVIENPNLSIVKNIDSNERGKGATYDTSERNARAGFRNSTETIVSTVSENEKSNTAFYDKSKHGNWLSTSGDKETSCLNGEQFLQVPTPRRRAKKILTLAAFPKLQLQKLQKKYGSFTFPKRDRRPVILKTAETPKGNDGKSEFHNRGDNGITLCVTENDETSTADHTFMGKTSQSYSDSMTLKVNCPLNRENKSQSLSAMTRVEHPALKFSVTENEERIPCNNNNMSDSDKVPSGDGVESTGNNSHSLPQTELYDPRGSDTSPATRISELSQTSESAETTMPCHKDDVPDNGRTSLCENCDLTETSSVVANESDFVQPTLEIRPGNRTLSDSNIHRTFSDINSTSNTKSDDVNNKDIAKSVDLTKSVSSSALYDHDSDTTKEASFPNRLLQLSQNSITVSGYRKQLSFKRVSQCTGLSISTHTLPADANSLKDYLHKHTEMNISSTSMNSISDTSIHELKLAVRGKLGARGRPSRSHKHGADNRNQKHRNLTLTVIVFNAMFILCNLPIIIYMAGRTYIFTGEKGTNSAQYVMEICSNYSMYTNNAINFLLYCITGSRFRQELRRMLCQFFKFLTGSLFCRQKQ